MGLIKLITNECVKIFKKRAFLFFLILAVISLIVSYGIVYYENITNMSNLKIDDSDDSMEYIGYKLNSLKTEYASANTEKQAKISYKIKTYEYALKNNIRIRFVHGGYRSTLINEQLNLEDNLDSIDISTMKKEYEKQIEKINKIQKILDDNSFEEYIAYNKEKIENDCKNNLITQEEYNSKIKQENLNLKYEVSKYEGKYYFEDWKQKLLYANVDLNFKIKNKFDDDKQKYLTEEGIKKLEEQKMINSYRLENNLADNNTLNSEGNFNEYNRWNFDKFGISISMFIVALLFIFLATSSISEETSRGTIKFLLITPYKRYKILLSKLISFIILLIIITLILSQINVVLGNVFFPNTTNEYIYINNNNVEVMNTNLYLALQYLLKLPEIIIYILLGITLSTLRRSTAIANTFTLMGFIGIPTALYYTEQFVKIDSLKYFPFKNFDLISKVFIFENINDSSLENSLNSTSLEFAVIVLSITALLLIITMFESFNKRDIL